MTPLAQRLRPSPTGWARISAAGAHGVVRYTSPRIHVAWWPASTRMESPDVVADRDGAPMLHGARFELEVARDPDDENARRDGQTERGPVILARSAPGNPYRLTLEVAR